MGENRRQAVRVLSVLYRPSRYWGIFSRSSGRRRCLSRPVGLCSGDVLCSFNYSPQGLIVSCRAAVRTSPTLSMGQ